MQPGLPQRLLRVRRRRQRGVRMRGAGRGGGSAPRACACRRVTVVAERGLRSSSLAVCRRDLKIIFRLSLPQTANSKMTVSPPAPPSAAAIGFMLHGGPLHRRSSGRSRVFSAAAAER
ncbi:kelch-like protein 15 isoform X3 [Columba livia]|uniref:kelch-like protein 15 isoform X3 n=1 Tax=Columba livia TaxID=8932 RepID=UPI0031BABC01